jgi:hypothetical protein
MLFLTFWGFIFISPENAHYVILLISLLLIIIGFKGLLPYSEAEKWIKSTATINSFKETYETVKEGPYSETDYYYPLVEYSYQHNDIQHTNNCVTFEKQNIWTSGYNNWGDKLPDSEKPWHTWSPGCEIEVFINPKKPQVSVLLPAVSKKRKSHHLALIVAGVLIFITWATLQYHNITMQLTPTA